MGIVRRILESRTCYSKGKYHHAEKYGNDGQGIVQVGGLVYLAGSLYVEVRGIDGIGMCNLEFISHKEGICWTYAMVNNEEILDRMGQYL